MFQSSQSMFLLFSAFCCATLFLSLAGGEPHPVHSSHLVETNPSKLALSTNDVKTSPKKKVKFIVGDVLHREEEPESSIRHYGNFNNFKQNRQDGLDSCLNYKDVQVWLSRAQKEVKKVWSHLLTSERNHFESENSKLQSESISLNRECSVMRRHPEVKIENEISDGMMEHSQKIKIDAKNLFEWVAVSKSRILKQLLDDADNDNNQPGQLGFNTKSAEITCQQFKEAIELLRQANDLTKTMKRSFTKWEKNNFKSKYYNILAEAIQWKEECKKISERSFSKNEHHKFEKMLAHSKPASTRQRALNFYQSIERLESPISKADRQFINHDLKMLPKIESNLSNLRIKEKQSKLDQLKVKLGLSSQTSPKESTYWNRLRKQKGVFARDSLAAKTVQSHSKLGPTNQQIKEEILNRRQDTLDKILAAKAAHHEPSKTMS